MMIIHPKKNNIQKWGKKEKIFKLKGKLKKYNMKNN